MSDQSRQNSEIDKSTISNVHFCSVCKKPLRRIIGKMGPFWGCTGYPSCKTTRYDVAGIPSQEADEHYRCPVCTRGMIRTSDKQGDYWYCTGYDKGCKVTLRDDNGRPEEAYRCKSCGQLLVKRKGRKGKFWGCSQYPKCTTTYTDENGKPNFDFFTS